MKYKKFYKPKNIFANRLKIDKIIKTNKNSKSIYNSYIEKYKKTNEYL